MSKFGLDPESDEDSTSSINLADRLAAFPVTTPRPRIDLAEVDQAAAAHGFISREQSNPSANSHGRRRRLAAVEPTRHLAIRLPLSHYDRFVAFADEHQLTYHDALAKLLKDAGW